MTRLVMALLALLMLFGAADAQKGGGQSGGLPPVVNGQCITGVAGQWVAGPCSGSGPSFANPTATAGPNAVNGGATTSMRSDAAPAIQLGSSSQKGIVQVDGTTITAAAGVISASGSGSGTVTSVSPGSAGLVFSPNPITATGTISLAGLTTVGDANCGTLTASGTATVAFNTVLTAARTCALPAASSFQAGQRLTIIDIGNGTNPAVNGANVITINRAGSDTILGQTSIVINVGYGGYTLQSDGSSKWGVPDGVNIPSPGASQILGSTSGSVAAWETSITASQMLALANGDIYVGNGSNQPVATAPGSNVLTAFETNLSAAGGLTTTIASGTAALGTSAISSATCATVVTATATNTLTTDVVLASFNGDPTGVTGYVPATTGMLTIVVYPTANTANFKVCNNTSASVTPGAITLNWRVVR